MSQSADLLVVSPLSPQQQSVDDWEHWEDDDIVTPIETAEQVLINAQPAPTPSTAASTKTTRALSAARASRQSVAKLKRLRSRQRQKAQNANAGIKLITDMTTFRRPTHIAHYIRSPDGKPAKFVDAAALRALEGEPNSASVGSWNWLKRSNTKSPASATPIDSARELSPEDRPIVIGISIPSDEANTSDVTPQSTGADTPAQIGLGLAVHGQSPPQYSSRASPASPLRAEQQVSVWSPDTPSTACSGGPFRPASSVYSQAAASTRPALNDQNVPPVPALPANYKKTHQQRLISLELGDLSGDEDDGGTPCTLFEEDGAPSPLRVVKGKLSAITPDSAESRSHGWWDHHVVTPFMEKRLTFTGRRQKVESPKDAESECCSSADTERPEEKKSVKKHLPVPIIVQPPIVRAPTPKRSPAVVQRSPAVGVSIASSSSSSSTRSSPALDLIQTFASSARSSPGLGLGTISSEKPRPGTSSTSSSARQSPALGFTSPPAEKSQIIITEVPTDQPPPYSPPKKQQGTPVRYRAVLPPGHPVHSQFPASPGPGSPGLAATMTSQGATPLTDIPVTPTVPRDMPTPPTMPLPNRPIGTSLPQEHSHSDRSRSRSVERQRQRHEKEEVVARRIGGFWRGRGCIPASGCFGRTGPEGRKRRRVWLGIIGGLIAAIILIVVLSVVLTRPKDSEEEPSIWVNLTDFPPMPTGVLTVVGPDNTDARNGCTEPSTLWSCAVPKDDQESLGSFEANQPTVIMQIQWNNGTDQSWNVPNGDPPAKVEVRSSGLAARAASMVRKRQDIEYTPDPKPPSFEEMWFLGDTTDDIKSNEKAGEPTPFYISLLSSVNDTTSSSTVNKRQTQVGDDLVSALVPPPDLLEDGTPAPAIMLPTTVHQPVRLFDRGLPTEHYGFYTYFKRTIYLKSVTRNDTDDNAVPLDEDGGCRKNEANFLATWSETRLLVRIWTRKLEDDSKLLPEEGGQDTDGSSGERLIRPGTMPYPVTVSLDTHGGNPDEKFVWLWPLDDRLKPDEENPQLMSNKIDFAGPLINPRKDRDDSFGGFDGGTGGCRCQWVNWT